MTREEIQSNMEMYKYNDVNQTGTRNFINTLIAQPLLDSYIKSAYAREAGVSFYHGLKTGIYNNFTFMGGYNVFGGGLFSPITSKITDIMEDWTQKIPFMNVQWQYLNRNNSAKVDYFTQSNLESHFVDDAGDLIESGLGFGKNTKALQILNSTGMKIDITAPNALSKESISKAITEHVKSLDADKLRSLGDALDVTLDVSRKTARKHYLQNNLTRELFENSQNHFQKKIAKELFGTEILTTQNIDDIMEAIKKPGGELFEKIMNSEIIQKRFSKVFTEEFYGKYYAKATEDITNKLIKEYVETTAIQRFFASTPVRFITGNLASGAIGTIFDFGLSAAGIMSSMHQDAAVSDFVSSSLYNYREKHFISSDAATESINSHLMISNSNANDYYSLLNNHNVSKNYLKDMDPIKSNFEYSKVENFTIF